MSDKLPPGWAWATLADLCSVEYGKALSKKQRVESGVIEVYGSAGLAGHHDQALVEEPVIVVGRKGNAGEVWLTNRPSWPIDTTYFLRPPQGLLPDFFALQLGHQDLVGLDSSTTIPSLRRPDLEATPVAITPVLEQERIVAAIKEHFSRLDAAEATLASVKRKLVSLQRSAVARLFDHAGWPWTTLGEIAEIKGGVTKDSKRQSDPSYIEVPYLRVANVQRGYLDLSEVSRIRVRPAKAAQLTLRTGDVLFNEGGDRDKLGRGWVWDGQIDGCIHQNHVFRARLSSEDFDPYFVSVHGNTWGQQWFETRGKQTTNLASLNLTTLKSLPVPAPPLAEQRKVVAEFQSIRRSEDRLRAEISRAESRSASLRRSILADAFAGRLVPQDPDDEPASVLLERIAASRSAGRAPQRSAGSRSARGAS